MIGAFDAHHESIMRELWLEVLPYFNKNKEYGSNKDRVFFAYIDYLEHNPNHWSWHKISSDETINPIELLKFISKEIYKESLFIEKKIFNKQTGMDEIHRVKINQTNYEYPQWIKTIKTSNNILVRYTDNKEIAIKGINEGIIISLEEYSAFKFALELDLSKLEMKELHQLISDIKSHPSDFYWSRFTTLRTFYEDLLTELGDSPVKSKKKDTTRNYKVGEGFQRVKKYSSSMLDALDTSSI
jgi:hypothetical protein